MRDRMRKRPKKSGANWLVTYSDMVTLILVFFILLFSMSQIDQQKFDSLSDSFSSRAILDFLPSAIQPDSSEQNGPGNGNDEGKLGINQNKEELNEEDSEQLQSHLEMLEQKADALEQLIESVDSFLEEEGLEDVITAMRTTEGVVLVLQDSILFEPAEAEVLETGKPFLDEVGKLFEDIPNDIRIEGHTDSKPIATYRYPSNWELSGARASSVIRYLLENFDISEDRFSLVGYGELKPREPNDTEANMNKNRRVEIIVLDGDAQK